MPMSFKAVKIEAVLLQIFLVDVHLRKHVKKAEKKIKKKKKKVLDKINGFVIHSFSLAALQSRAMQTNWSLKLKGRERRKKPKSEIFGKEISVEQRMEKEADKAMNSCFIVIFSKGQRS